MLSWSRLTGVDAKGGAEGSDLWKDLSLTVQLLSLQQHSAVAFYLSWMALGPFTALLQS